MTRKLFKLLSLCMITLFTNIAYAQGHDEVLSIYWVIPFATILLSIAICPIAIPKIWHAHYGKIIAVGLAIFLTAFFYSFESEYVIHGIAHTLIEEYLPFVILLTALYTVSGGIFITGGWAATPMNNCLLLLIGACLASVMGTTGAAMLMLKPLIRANIRRRNKVHTIIFFIFLVANIGGGLTPLGDPPLFIGFLHGVGFLWTLQHMFIPVLLTVAILLAIFYCIDSYYYKKEGKWLSHVNYKFKVVGLRNLILLLGVIAAILIPSFWHTSQELSLFGISTIKYTNIARELSLLMIIFLSLYITPKKIRISNHFTWEPMLEIAKLFIGIFIMILPVIEMLKAGENGAFAGMLALVSDDLGNPIPSIYFALSGVLSAFLDNAPTYLVFFNLASGNAQILMYHETLTLLALSMGTVFMGAATYIGNAPNFMVKSIATQYRIQMPGFFGYMKWSCGILVPVLLVIMVIIL